MCNFFKIITLAVISFLFMSCGGTTVKVRQSSDGVNATVSVTTNNPTNVEVTPSINVDVGELGEVLDSLQNLSSEPISFNFDEYGEMIINLDELCKSISPRTLIRHVPYFESQFMKYYTSTQNLQYPHIPFSIEKMRNINFNSCLNPDVVHSSAQLM